MKGRTILSVAAVILLSMAVTLPVMPEGDTPSDVYAVYVVAQQDGNIEGICAYITEDKVKQLETMSNEEKIQISEMLKMMAPTEYIVVTEDIQGDNATIILTGKANDFAGGLIDQSGTVTLVKEGGAWKIVQERWEQISSE